MTLTVTVLLVAPAGKVSVPLGGGVVAAGGWRCRRRSPTAPSWDVAGLRERDGNVNAVVPLLPSALVTSPIAIDGTSSFSDVSRSRRPGRCAAPIRVREAQSERLVGLDVLSPTSRHADDLRGLAGSERERSRRRRVVGSACGRRPVDRRVGDGHGPLLGADRSTVKGKLRKVFAPSAMRVVATVGDRAHACEA